MARPRAKVPRVRKDFYIRADLAATVDLVLTDPMRNKAQYGAWSEFVEGLVSRWLSEQKGRVKRVDPYKVQLALTQLKLVEQDMNYNEGFLSAIRLLEEASQ